MEEKNIIKHRMEQESIPVLKNYTYILLCSDGSLYCGWTNNLDKRVKHHNSGKASKYTRSRLPVRLVYVEAFATRREAMMREYEIKQLSRIEKCRLIDMEITLF